MAKKTKIGKFLEKKKKQLTKSVGALKLAILTPFKPSMIKLLNQKGVAVPKNIKMEDLVTKFYNVIVKKNDKKSSLDENWYENGNAFYTSKNSFDAMEKDDQDNLINEVATIVKEIISWFKKKKDDKIKVEEEANKKGISIEQASKNLGIKLDSENAIADATAKDIEKKSKGGDGLLSKVGFNVGTQTPDFTNIVIIIAVLIGIYFIAKR